MARLLPDWLDGYLEYTKETEPPLSYHIWTALSVISGALQRKVHFNWGHSKIYPNMYVILIGPSGQTRKGEALNIGRGFVDDLGIPTVSQSIIREALVRSIGNSLNSFSDPDTGKMEWHCSSMCISDELSVFLGQKHIKFLADLTDWYDSRDVWTYETKHQGTDRLMGVCLNLLGATAPDWLPSILPQEAVGGGWTSRTIFVVEEYKGKIIVNPNLVGIDEKLKESLTSDLEQIHLLMGEIKFSDSALDCYIKWYQKQEDGIKNGVFPVPDPRFAGYAARRATHVKKVCMALSASRGDDMTVTLEDFNRGIAILGAAEKKMSRAFGGLGRARFADITNAVLNYIMARKVVRRSEVLRRFMGDVDSWSLEQIEKVLGQMKVVTVTYTEDGDAEYRFIGEKNE